MKTLKLNEKELLETNGGGISVYFPIICVYPFPNRSPKTPICDPIYGCHGAPQNS